MQISFIKAKFKTIDLIKIGCPIIEYKNKGKYVKIWYKNSKGSQPKPILLKREIIINEKFFEGLGLYIGECERSKKGKAMSFTNSDMNIIKFIINWLEEYFGISKKELGCTVISPRENPTINQRWSKILGLEINQFTKPSIPISNPGNKERARIFRNLILYRILFEVIFEEIMKLCLNVNSWGNGLLRGFYAAEGSVSLRKKKINQIYVSSKDISTLNIIYQLFQQRKIIPNSPPKECKKGRNKDNQYEIKIFSLENFKKAKKIDLFKLNRERHINFNEGLKKLMHGCRSGQTGWA
jgi:hypothetical protein